MIATTAAGDPRVRAAASSTGRAGDGSQGLRQPEHDQQRVGTGSGPAVVYELPAVPLRARKNSTDIALSLDALELLLDKRAQTFCLVTGDSDFAYLCRKLRERGAVVYIAGEAKSPEALRSACDQFFEWTPVAKPVAKVADVAKPIVAPVAKVKKQAPKKAPAASPRPKQSPSFVAKAVETLMPSSPNGRVTLNSLVEEIRRTQPAFKPNTYGHSTLAKMVKTYSGLKANKGSNGHWEVSLAPKTTNGSTAKKA